MPISNIFIFIWRTKWEGIYRFKLVPLTKFKHHVDEELFWYFELWYEGSISSYTPQLHMCLFYSEIKNTPGMVKITVLLCFLSLENYILYRCILFCSAQNWKMCLSHIYWYGIKPPLTIHNCICWIFKGGNWFYPQLSIQT